MRYSTKILRQEEPKLYEQASNGMKVVQLRCILEKATITGATKEISLDYILKHTTDRILISTMASSALKSKGKILSGFKGLWGLSYGGEQPCCFGEVLQRV